MKSLLVKLFLLNIEGNNISPRITTISCPLIKTHLMTLEDKTKKHVEPAPETSF